MDKIKNNWFKLGLLVILLACLCLGFFFLHEQVKIKREQQISTLDSSCQKTASDLKKEIGADEGTVKYKYIRSFEYKYNQTINGCILAYVYDAEMTFFNDHTPYRKMMIENLTTGEVLFEAHPEPGDASLKAYNKFNELRERYLSPLINN